MTRVDSLVFVYEPRGQTPPPYEVRVTYADGRVSAWQPAEGDKLQLLTDAAVTEVALRTLDSAEGAGATTSGLEGPGPGALQAEAPKNTRVEFGSASADACCAPPGPGA